MFPELFSGTAYEVPTWYFMLFSGFLFVLVLMARNRPENFPLSKAGIVITASGFLLLGLLGAQTLNMLLNWTVLTASEEAIAVRVAHSGYALLGSLGAHILLLTGIAKIRPRKDRISFLSLADYFFPFLFLHLVFVRTGCFSVGCCHGKPTDVFWAFSFQSHPPKFYHPTQLYNLAALLVNFSVMRHFYKKGVPLGVTFFGSFALYGFFRFWTEFLRVDSVEVWAPFTLANIAMFLIFVTSALATLFFIKRGRAGKA